MKNALLIFTRNPIAGKVKTRIAATAGDKMALAIYKQLLHHTHETATGCASDKFVFYSDYLQTDDLWEDNIYQKILQAGESLGDKMKNAFQHIFQSGYKKAVIIGSDCYELTPEILASAFAALDENDAVIGPAKDGGYYLLGLKQLVPRVFENKQWSTSTVLAKTIDDFESAGLAYYRLPVLQDVDTMSDVPEALLTLVRTS